MRHAKSRLSRLRRSPRASLSLVTAVCAVTTLSFSVSTSLGSAAPEVAESAAASQDAGELAAGAPTDPSVSAAQAPAEAATSAVAEDTAASSEASEDPEEAEESAPAAGSGPAATARSETAAAAPAPVAVPAPPVAAAGSPLTAAVPSGTWLSGASGDGVADGSFAKWRGSPVTVGGTWADNNEAMTELWQLDPGGEFGKWNQALDIAIGAIGDGESWQQAANGAYDQRWRESLTNLKAKWGNRTAPLFIRFAHEMNGNWYTWSVDEQDKDAFIAAWRHFRELQKEIFPAAKLVFCVNRESVGSGFDWRESFPGAQYVDVMAVDYYNQYPYVATAADWAKSLTATDGHGAPKGLQKHLEFARSVGLPLAVPEWSGNADEGDSAAFIQGMGNFFRTNAGGGAGQIAYDVMFNIDKDGGRWLLYGDTRMPASASAYQSAF
ncbi:glycoside hydrolase family 26 protein [Modestobacter marinus]|uniref:glycoside hydrolase family 26 protein n=1 Tax=Modestobacter marinus TaxID=477641 RepID=UPI001C97BAED|nr:glycosyl hydrolase [Modestobacter marinus]